MPFCPECKYEYVSGIKKCADCEADLVAALPKEERTHDFKWVPLHSFSGPVYAEMVKESLEQNNIPCLIQKDVLSSAYGIQGTSAGGLQTVVFVPEGTLKESEEIMNQITGD